jgi:hypothetical protein
MKMKSGDTFTLDVQSLDELAAFGKTSVADLTTKINVGDTFSIAKTELCGGEVIRASKWDDGKPKRGRPRRFPRAVVLRLLGETEEDGAPLAPEEVLEVEQAEEQDALERRANELLGVGAGSVGTPGTNSEDEDDSW